jgi:hypothetical protein
VRGDRGARSAQGRPVPRAAGRHGPLRCRLHRGARRAGGEPYALEINVCEGGTSHPYGALWLLTDGQDGLPHAARRRQALLRDRPAGRAGLRGDRARRRPRGGPGRAPRLGRADADGRRVPHAQPARDPGPPRRHGDRRLRRRRQELYLRVVELLDRMAAERAPAAA